MELFIGKIIQKRRKELGLTQEQLASAVGVSTPAVSKWESEASYPDVTLLPPLARILKLTLNELLLYQAELTDAERDQHRKSCASAFLSQGTQAGLAAAARPIILQRA